MSARIKFYSKFMYGFFDLLYFYVPYKYKFNEGIPDTIVPTNVPNAYKAFGIFSVFFQILFVIYLYGEAFFGALETFEFFLVMGTNGIQNVLVACHLYFLKLPLRKGIIGIMNLVLQFQFKNAKPPTFQYEIIHFALTNSAVTYTILFFPNMYFFYRYMPRMFHTANKGLVYLASAIGGNDPAMALFVESILQLVLILVLAVALGHGVVSLMPGMLWQIMYHASIVSQLEEMLNGMRNR